MNFRRIALAVATLATLGAIHLPAVKRGGRRALSASVRRVLRGRAQPYAAPGDAVALVVSPHQDDETLGCGGVIAGKRRNGQAVHVAFVTDGSASHRGHPTLSPAALAQRRADEARAALRILGVEANAVHFLGAPDGELSHLPTDQRAQLTADLVALLMRIQPTEVFLPFRFDGSAEHTASFALFREALDRTALRPRIYEFPVWSWWNPLLLINAARPIRRVVRYALAGHGQLKSQALSAYRSQIEAIPPWTNAPLPREFPSYFLAEEEFFFEL